MTQSSKKKLGDRGEGLVAQWLRCQGWQIVAQQWHCRWGELDIVVYQTIPPCLAFVEVKTRGRNSVDLGGRLAITRQKQQKLWRSAQAFLSQHSHYGEVPCRFDVALVARGATAPGEALMTQAIADPPSVLALVDYIPDAFQLG